MATWARLKVWIPGDVLTAGDLNSEFNNIGLLNTFDWTWSGIQTFNNGSLKTKGGGAGVATIIGANTASNRTLTLPDATDTLVGLAATQTLTAKKLTAVLIDGAGAGDATLQYANSANSRTVTIPDPGAAADFVMTEGAATVNGVKTFTGANVHNGAETFLAPVIGIVDKGNSSTGTVTCDCSTGSKFLITATGNFTLAFSNFTNNQRVEVWILQDGTGSRTVTWPTAVRWLNGTGATNSTTDAPTLTTTINKFDVISFEKFDAVGTDNNIYAFVRGYKGAIT